MSKEIGRRAFLKGGLGVAGAAALSFYGLSRETKSANAEDYLPTELPSHIKREGYSYENYLSTEGYKNTFFTPSINRGDILLFNTQTLELPIGESLTVNPESNPDKTMVVAILAENKLQNLQCFFPLGMNIWKGREFSNGLNDAEQLEDLVRAGQVQVTRTRTGCTSEGCSSTRLAAFTVREDDGKQTYSKKLDTYYDKNAELPTELSERIDYLYRAGESIQSNPSADLRFTTRMERGDIQILEMPELQVGNDTYKIDPTQDFNRMMIVSVYAKEALDLSYLYPEQRYPLRKVREYSQRTSDTEIKDDAVTAGQVEIMRTLGTTQACYPGGCQTARLMTIEAFKNPEGQTAYNVTSDRYYDKATTFPKPIHKTYIPLVINQSK